MPRSIVSRATFFDQLPCLGHFPYPRGTHSRDVPAGRAVVERQPIHVHDLAAEVHEFPEVEAAQKGSAIGLRLPCRCFVRDFLSGLS